MDRLTSILAPKEIELLTRTRDILEEILETMGIGSDRRTLKALHEGLRDMKHGRVRPYSDFARELHSSHEL